MKVDVTFSLLSYWHAGTGRGHGEQADAVVQRSRAGLPFLPGRTVKGLLRSAVQIGVDAGVVEPDELVAWFGSPLVDDPDAERVTKLEQARFASRPGALRFSSAVLGSAWESWASSQVRGRDGAATALAPLFTTLASTAIAEDGTADDRTLRTIEAAVPMTLRAEIEGPDGRWPAVFADIAPFLRTLGSGRNRGLGRVRLTVESR